MLNKWGYAAGHLAISLILFLSSCGFNDEIIIITTNYDVPISYDLSQSYSQSVYSIIGANPQGSIQFDREWIGLEKSSGRVIHCGGGNYNVINDVIIDAKNKRAWRVAGLSEMMQAMEAALSSAK